MNGLDHAACWTCLERRPSVTWLLTQRKTIHPFTTATTHTPRPLYHAYQPLSLYLSLPLSLSFPLIYLSTNSILHIPPSPSFPNPTHPFIHLPNPIHPSIRPIKPQSRSAGGFSHHLFFSCFRKEGIDRSCGMLACVCVSFFLFFLGGGLPLSWDLSCRR